MHADISRAISAVCAALMVGAFLGYTLRQITFIRCLDTVTPATAVGMLATIGYFPHLASLLWLGAFTVAAVAWSYNRWVERTCHAAEGDLDDQN